MDVIYPLGNGSHWHNKELMYSLRSVQKFLKGFRKIFIIGEFPPWLKGVEHIPYSEQTNTVHFNIKEKILCACRDKRVSENFFFFNDDYMLIQKFSIQRFPFFTHRTLEESVERRRMEDVYRAALNNTMKALRARKLPEYNFDCHCPIVYNKKKFQEVMAQYDWTVFAGYVVKSLYCNTLKKTPLRMPDCKIDSHLLAGEIKNKIDGRFMFSIGDGSLNTSMKAFLEELYPKPSRWEKN